MNFLHSILTDGQLAAAIFAMPFVMLAVFFAAGMLLQTDSRTARVTVASIERGE